MCATGPRFRQRLSLAVVVLSNLFPLFAVVELGWDARPLLVFYWLELGVVVVWGSVESLFAEKRSVTDPTDLPFDHLFEKRGGRALWSGGPPAYPRNVPFAVTLAGVGLLWWTVYGVAIVGRFGVDVFDPQFASVVVGGAGAFLGRGLEFRSEFVGEGEFRETSARMVAAGPVRQLVAVLVLGLFILGVERTHTAGLVVLGPLVAGKVAYELYSYRARHSGSSSAVLDWVFGERDTALPRAPVREPDGPPNATVRTDTRASMLSSLFVGLFAVAGRYYLVLAFVGVVGFVGLAGGTVVLAVAVVGVVAVLSAAVAVNAASHYLHDGWLEYRRYDGALVAYDRLLDEPQWRLPPARVYDVSAVRTVANRLAGTGTIRLKRRDADGDQVTTTVGPFADGRVAVRTLDLPRFEPPPDPDRTVAYAAMGIVAAFAVPFAGLYLTGELSAGATVLLGLVLFPTLAVVLGPLLWTALLNW